MSETPSRCVCGAEAQPHGFPHSRWIECDECGWSGPVETTERKAVTAWNAVMGKGDIATTGGEVDG